MSQRLHWVSPERGLVTRTPWSAYLDRAQPLDPYLIWADMSGFLGFGGWEQTLGVHQGRLPLLLEFSASDLCAKQVPELGLLRIPGIYLNQAGELRFPHVTGLVQATEIGKLLACDKLVRFQLATPRLPGVGNVRPSLAVDISDKPGRTVLGFIDDGCAFAHPQMADAKGLTRVYALWDQERPEPGDTPVKWSSNPLLAYGMELRRDQLLQACNTGGPAADPARAPFGPYEAVDYVPLRHEFGRSSVRRHGPWLRPPLAAMANGTHGSAVMDLAMGRQPPLRQRLRHSDISERALRDGDRADEWAAVFVQLPSATVLDTSGGSLAYHVLDGLHYIIDRAQRIAPIGVDENREDKRQYPDNRIVVTVPYGAIAGGHDGGSIIERAMTALAQDTGQQRLWVVLAAGNAHRSHSHARLTLRPGQPGHLWWSVPPDNPLESYLEIWLDLHDADGHELPDVADRLLVGLKPPGGPRLQLTLGQWRSLCDPEIADPAAACLAGAVFARRVVQSDRPATMVLLTSAPTRRALPGEGPARGLGLSGEWEVALTYHPQADPQPSPVLQIQAWVERSDLVFGSQRGLQSRVRTADEPVPLPTEFVPDAAAAQRGWHQADARLQAAFDPPRGLGSMSGGAPWPRPIEAIGDAEEPLLGAVLSVGAYRISDGEMSADSSGGPGREWSVPAVAAALSGGTASGRAKTQRQAPDADAPGDVSAAVRGLPVAGTVAGRVQRLSGTSAAAPTVARAIANAQTPPPNGALPSKWAEVSLSRAERPAAEGPLPSPSVGRANPARGTPHPTLDDRFRRGRWRAR